jgi:hypothetical protein
MNTSTLTLAQLTDILSALEGQPRRPKNRAAAVANITRWATAHDLTFADVAHVADALMDGRFTAADFLEELRDLAELQAEGRRAEEVYRTGVAERGPMPPPEARPAPKVDGLIELATGPGFTLADARDVLGIPNPKAKALAEALAAKLKGEVVLVRDGGKTRYRVIRWERVT